MMHDDLMFEIGETLEIYDPDDIVLDQLTLTDIDVENVVHVFGEDEDDIIDRPCMVRAIIKVHSFDPVTCQVRYELHDANVFLELEDDTISLRIRLRIRLRVNR